LIHKLERNVTSITISGFGIGQSKAEIVCNSATVIPQPERVCRHRYLLLLCVPKRSDRQRMDMGTGRIPFDAVTLAASRCAMQRGVLQIVFVLPTKIAMAGRFRF